MKLSFCFLCFVFKGTALGRWAMFQWMAITPWIYRQHKLALIVFLKSEDTRLSGDDGGGNGLKRSWRCRAKIHFMKFSSINKILFEDCLVYLYWGWLLKVAMKHPCHSYLVLASSFYYGICICRDKMHSRKQWTDEWSQHRSRLRRQECFPNQLVWEPSLSCTASP